MMRACMLALVVALTGCGALVAFEDDGRVIRSDAGGGLSRRGVAVTPERVAERLAVLLAEMLPAEPRATFYDRARQTMDLLALVVGAEERREFPNHDAAELAERAARRFADVTGWRCTATRCRPVMRRNRAV